MSPTRRVGSARLLLSRLRQLMADGGTVQHRLDRMVEAVANTMVADVCSIYLRTRDEKLELTATEGLSKDAVHRTQLALDEGLVGLIAATARPLNLKDAPRHPNFSYRPETGEDPYHAFLGVPVIRSGRVLGVLVVQNQNELQYDDEEVEALQTIATVLAEIVASEEGPSENGLADFEVRPSKYEVFQAKIMSEGIAIGPAKLHDPIVPTARFFAADPELEEQRLEVALVALRRSIESMLSREGASLWGAPREVLESYRLFAHDVSWANRLKDGVRAGLSAEASVDRARREHRARLEKARDPYLRERLHDLEDLENRLLLHLSGEEIGRARFKGLKGAVLVARRLGPAELLEYRDAGLTAILVEEGGQTSHAAIVARALDMPALGGFSGLVSSVEEGDMLVVDAENGSVHVRPDSEIIDTFEGRIVLRGQRRAEFARLRDEPARTQDDVDIRLTINAGLDLDLDHLSESGAQGVGLFRTEFQFLVSETLPRLDDQIDLYRRVLEKAGDRPVVFRTLDLGGDKVVPYLGYEREENPALGWRAIRIALDREGIFRRQLRALIRAAEGRALNVMFPLITIVDEFDRARGLLERELKWSIRQGHEPPTSVQVGAMIETPSIVWGLEALAARADFLSIGTNDLMQYFFAVDRDNARMAQRYDMVSGPALRFLSDIAARARACKVPVTICGEAAGRPLEALVMMLCGFRQLSMAAPHIGPVKRMIRSVRLRDLQSEFDLLKEDNSPSVRHALLTLMTKNAIVL